MRNQKIINNWKSGKVVSEARRPLGFLLFFILCWFFGQLKEKSMNPMRLPSVMRKQSLRLFKHANATLLAFVELNKF